METIRIQNIQQQLTFGLVDHTVGNSRTKTTTKSSTSDGEHRTTSLILSQEDISANGTKQTRQDDGSHIYTCYQPSPTRKAQRADGLRDIKMWKIVEEWLDIFQEVDLDSWFLHAGSLLGFARGCQMAEDDVDFAVPIQWWGIKQNKERLEGAIRRRGYRFRWSFGAFGTPGKFGYEESWTKDSSHATKIVKIDLFSVVEKTESYVWSMWKGPQGKKTAWPCIVQRQKVVQAKWYRNNNTEPLLVRVPVPFGPAMTSLYGPEWTKPFPGTWRWDVEPFTVGSCSNNLKDVPEM